jgi:molybdenum cofactor guanylyltransferase
MRGVALYGLVLAGGKSSRMGEDKGLLVYRDRPQREWLADLLAPVCDAVYISINAGQARSGGLRHAVVIDDERFDASPIGALLSADALYPGVSWLLLSCDLAYFDGHCLSQLIAARNPDAAAVAYRIAELDQPHPMAAIYEAALMARLPDLYASGERSLRQVLVQAGARMIDAPEADCVRSVDTPEELHRARARLAAKWP